MAVSTSEKYFRKFSQSTCILRRRATFATVSDTWSRKAGLRVTCKSLIVLLVAASIQTSFAEDTLAKIKSTGTLAWGGDAEGGAPYSYPNPDKPDEIIGFEVELADALAAKLGVKAKMVQN